MSFDLAVWHSATAVSDADALRTYEMLCEGDTTRVSPHSGVVAFYMSLIAQYPELDALEDDELDARGVWTAGLDVSDAHVIMPIAWTRAAEVAPTIRRLADNCGLLCFDPQIGIVHLPARIANPRLSMAIGGDHPTWDPEPNLVVQRSRQALSRGAYVVLERGDQRYVQAGSGASVGLALQGYAVEYRDGSADRHFRFETEDLADVLAVFEAFARDDSSYQTRFAWRPYCERSLAPPVAGFTPGETFSDEALTRVPPRRGCR